MTDHADSEKTVLRVKLDDLSSALKKLGNHLKQIGEEKSNYLLELDDINDLLSLAGKLESFESLEGNEGAVFASFIKNLTDTIGNIASLGGWEKKYNEEETIFIISNLRSVEEKIKDIGKILGTIDDQRKKADFETFGGLLLKLNNAIDEKKYLLGKNIK